MPTYEYRCAKGHEFEVIQKMSDDPIERCEQCDLPVERMFRPVAIHFKGSGFYATDYGRRKGSTGDPTSGSDGDSGTSSKDGSSKDGSSKEGSSKDGSSKDGSSKADAKTGSSSAAKSSD